MKETTMQEFEWFGLTQINLYPLYQSINLSIIHHEKQGTKMQIYNNLTR